MSQDGKGFSLDADGRVYLLNIRELAEDCPEGSLFAKAMGKVDDARRRKAEQAKTVQGKAAIVGAGLLLQRAVRGWESKEGREDGLECRTFLGSPSTEAFFPCVGCSVRGLLMEPQEARQLTYRYGQDGKPYFEDIPLYFSISHSGDYVLLAVSGREIGADIQAHRAGNVERIAKRYFSSEEVRAFYQAQDRDAFFFRLWARKEAYGKLTGRGLADSIEKDLWSGGTEIAGKLSWGEYGGLPGYSMAVCQYRPDSRGQ